MLQKTKALLFLAIPLVLSCPVKGFAADFHGESRTYLQAENSSDDKTIGNLREYLDLNIDNAAGQSVSVHAGGWLRASSENAYNNKQTDGDMQYAYVRYRGESGLTANLGRLQVYDGPSVEFIDGAYLRADLKGGFGVSAYGGDSARDGGKTIYGGRLSHSAGNLYTLGASYLKEDNSTAGDREEAAIDLSLTPTEGFSIQGSSAYNSKDSGWMEHSYSAMIGSSGPVRVRADFQEIDYGRYFTSATTSAFSASSTGSVLLNSNEKLTRLGGEVLFSAGQNVTISADYRNYDYDIAGAAKKYGATFSFTSGSDVQAGISAHRMDGNSDMNRYNEFRVFCASRHGKFDLAFDALDIVYDEKINGVDNAYDVSATAVYGISERASASATLDYANDPRFERQLKGIIKLTCKFGKNPWGV